MPGVNALSLRIKPHLITFTKSLNMTHMEMENGNIYLFALRESTESNVFKISYCNTGVNTLILYREQRLRAFIK